MYLETYSGHDPIARIFNEEWAEGISDRVMQPLEKLLLRHLPEGAHILDLCCGTGHMAQKLLMKGYKVTGLDESEGMLRYAQENAPGAKFILGDARNFELPPTFGGIASNGSLCYVMNLEELMGVFRSVYAALLENGLFVFNLPLEERYQYYWHGTTVGNIKDDYAWGIKRSYYSEEKIGQNNITIFQLIDGKWQRFDSTLLEKCFDKFQVQSALENVGFTEVNVYDAKRDFGINERAGDTYFVCRQRLSQQT
ncbi:hypothetical protein BZZ01_17375 [Nostocales cyanobacterium HT-58-2]|nr:hypothetical protein BZZ01_17375 [Nostocales cyanobacterium HT-58-2]